MRRGRWGVAGGHRLTGFRRPVVAGVEQLGLRRRGVGVE